MVSLALASPGLISEIAAPYINTMTKMEQRNATNKQINAVPPCDRPTPSSPISIPGSDVTRQRSGSSDAIGSDVNQSGSMPSLGQFFKYFLSSPQRLNSRELNIFAPTTS